MKREVLNLKNKTVGDIDLDANIFGVRKPFSQKGTGNARQGSNKPPNFRGGAVSMGPINRDYSFSLNKKEKKLALKSALSIKNSEDKIIIIDTFEIRSFKTKDLFSDLKKFNYESALFIHSESGLDKNFMLASSNIPKVSTLNQKGINVKDLITFDKIFIEKKSINEISKRLSWKIKMFLLKELMKLSRSL